MSNDKIKVLVVPSDRQGVGHFRSIWSAKYFKKHKREDFDVKIDLTPHFDNINYLSSFDIIHFHRQLGPYEMAEKLFPELRGRGVTLVMDIDDYWSPPPTHPLYDLVKNEKIDEKIEKNLSLVDWVTTTTEIFAKKIRDINPNVFVIPNTVNKDSKMWKSEPTPSTGGKTRIAWIGGACYDDKTEILTDQGFKLFKDLDGSEQVATLGWNEEKGCSQVELHKPKEYIKKRFTGQLNCAKNENVDYAVTPNHNMYVADGINKAGYRLVPSEEVYGTDITTLHYELFGEGEKCDNGVSSIYHVKKDEHFKKDYDDFVYCVNVTNHIICTRRNGKVMWCGNSHLHDLYLLKDSMHMFQEDKELRDKSQIVMCGFDVRGDVSYIDQHGNKTKRPIQPHETIWLQFEKIFTDNYKLVKDSPEYFKWLKKIQKEGFDDQYKQNYVRRWTQPLTSYGHHYDYCDICLAPLVETIDKRIMHGKRPKIIKTPHTFNLVKSELKVIEAGVKKKALIAQDFGVYAEKIKDGETGLLVKNNKAGWYKAIKKLVENPEYREEIANNLHQWVSEEYSVDRINNLREQFYKKVMEEKRESIEVK